MAKYKSGYKKENPQVAVLKTIIAIVGAVLLLVAATFIYDKATDWKDYSSYEHLDTYDQILSQDSDDYVVYFYSKTSTTSVEIKNDVLKVLHDLDQDVYLVNVDELTEAEVEEDETAYTEDTLLAALSIDELTSPMIVTVADGDFEEAIIGKVKIQSVLDQLESQTYQAFID